MANDAIIKGYLSILVYSWIAYYVVFGFYLGKLASARSKDAFGHGKLAFMAFLPLLNLILLLKKPKTDQGFTHMKVASIFQGKIGIAVGFILLFAFVTSGAIQTQLSASMAKKVSVADANAILSKTIDAIGLERSLLDIAKTTRVPIRVDKDIELSKISAGENSLIREFKVSNPLFEINKNVRIAIYDFVCSHEYLRLLGGKGMVLEERYTRPDGSSIGSVEVNFNYFP